MQTSIVPPTRQNIEQAAALLRAGQLVGMPTETVYGLAASALDDEAVARIFEAKGRPQDNPLIVHVANLQQLQQVAAPAPQQQNELDRLAETFWPGPLTIVLPKQNSVSARVTAGLDTVAVRMPAHPVALALIEECGFPLAAPSANRSGSPSPTTAQHTAADMQGRIQMVLDGGPCRVGLESTVLLLGEMPTILRPGYVTKQQLEQALGRPVEMAASAESPPEEDVAPQSPGVKYRHYAPKANITILDGTTSQMAEYIKSNAAPGVHALCYEEQADAMPVPAVTFGRGEDPESQAVALFAALRRLDELAATTVYATMPRGAGVAQAVRNRLLRAAAFRVVRL